MKLAEVTALLTTPILQQILVEPERIWNYMYTLVHLHNYRLTCSMSFHKDIKTLNPGQPSTKISKDDPHLHPGRFSCIDQPTP